MAWYRLLTNIGSITTGYLTASEIKSRINNGRILIDLGSINQFITNAINMRAVIQNIRILS